MLLYLMGVPVVTKYNNKLISIYFNRILKTIINIADLDKKKNRILDFGCGTRELSKKIKKAVIFNYDINLKYSDYKDYANLNFNVVVMNQVLMYLSLEEANIIFNNFLKKNKNIIFVIGISKINLFSRFLLQIVNFFTNDYKNAHKNLSLSYDQQVDFLKTKLVQIRKKNVFFLTDVFLLKFK